MRQTIKGQLSTGFNFTARPSVRLDTPRDYADRVEAHQLFCEAFAHLMPAVLQKLDVRIDHDRPDLPGRRHIVYHEGHPRMPLDVPPLCRTRYVAPADVDCICPRV